MRGDRNNHPAKAIVILKSFLKRKPPWGYEREDNSNKDINNSILAQVRSECSADRGTVGWIDGGEERR